MEALVAQLTDAKAVARAGTLDEHFAVLAALPFAHSVDRAAAGGFLSDRLGFAFVAGYRAALQRLVPDLEGVACLCATEAGGGHPRAIQTTLDRVAGTLSGTKTFATLATHATTLLVVAKVGESDGKSQLVVVTVPRDRAGVALEAKPPWPIAPEIPHAVVHLDGVRIAPNEVLQGDGYDRYLKPFRTIEDVHVLAAAAGHLAALARPARWDHGVVEALVATIAALRTISDSDSSHFGTHIALAGTIAGLRQTIATLDLGSLDPDVRARWERDAPLLEVAGKARAARREAAWRGR